MSISFYCPSGHRLSVSEKRAGEKIQCPKCEQTAVVPSASSDANKGGKPDAEAEGSGAKADKADASKSPAEETQEGNNERAKQLAQRRAEKAAKLKEQEEAAQRKVEEKKKESETAEKPRSKPPPLPPPLPNRKTRATGEPATKEDPTQPKHKKVPKVEIPEKENESEESDDVLDAEAPKPRVKPRRASSEWTRSAPNVPPVAPPKKETPAAKKSPPPPPTGAKQIEATSAEETSRQRTKPPEPPPIEHPSPTSSSAGPPPPPPVPSETHAEPTRSSESPDVEQRRGRRDRKRSKREEAAASQTGSVATEAPPPEPPAKRRRGPKLIPPNAYQADKGSLATTRWLAAILTFVVLFSLLPLGYLAIEPYITEEPTEAAEGEEETLGAIHREYESYVNLELAPGWARVIVLIAIVQFFYITWMLAAPDWAGVWVVMIVFAIVTTAYGMVTAMAIAWPVERPIPDFVGLEDNFRSSVKYWSGCVLAVMGMATYLCGRASAKWRRTCELEIAGRHRAPVVRM